ncbi:hypothetical protein VK96_05975 [Bacillus cereus]|uniref:hypothetical protein n=1 Tax=Bacillus cereus TaxID=1396 RepID=UPI00065D3A05|nr:hypothetical protein [Bacillus cereus]KMN72592.1 hypothetical protein VK96_05975 [Bacillus cereus]
MKEYLPYLPLVIAIIAASLGYVTGQRSGKINRFFQQVDINLKEVCGPMHFSLKRVFEIEDAQKREEYTDQFFEEFSTLNPNLYKLGNKFIIDWFIETENLYNKFKKSRELGDWEEYWKQLYGLKVMLGYEYEKNFDSLYGEYRWFQRTLTANIFVRIWHELIYILFQAIQFVVFVAMLFVYLSIWDYLFIGQFPKGMISVSILILVCTIMLYGLLMIIGANISGLRKQRNSFARKLGKRYAPNLIDFWDKKVIRSNKNVEIPEMYKQRKY